MIKYEFHPLSKSLPLMYDPDFSEFCDDIDKNGQYLPISIFEGKILDGRNRYRACQKLKIEGKFEKVSPKDAVAYVTSLNVYRRQLTRDQKNEYLMLLIAQQETTGMTNAEVAKATKVSKRTVMRKKRAARGDKKADLSPPSNGEKTKQVVEVDDDNVEIPSEALPYWNRRNEIQNFLTRISKLRTDIENIPDGDPLYAYLSKTGVTSDLGSAYRSIKGVLPAHVCPYCHGKKIDRCKPCKGTGVMSKFVMSNVPKKMEQPF